MHLKALMACGLFISLNACTLNEDNSHTTVCLKLTEHLMGISDLKSHSNTMRTENKDHTLSIDISWQDNKKGEKPLTMTANCIYLSDANDAGEDFNIRVSESYQTLPEKMFINDQAVRPEELYASIQKVMGISVKETISKKILK